MRYILGTCLFALVFISSSFITPNGEQPAFLEENDTWSDSILSAMSLEEKIGQLFMVAAYSNRGEKHVSEIETLIQKHHIGGLIFFQGGPVRQARLTNQYQSLTKVPLLIAMDAEWGLSMRLDSTPSFPRQLMLGAIRDNTIIYQMGREIARECKALGVHVSFSPVIDVNNNPLNPVINDRSFGENKYNVAQKGILYMKGLQDSHVLACAKHFPGHGDTDKDSHKTLPLISHDKNRLDSLELYPFKQLIQNGVGSIMVAHLQVPALDSGVNVATSLSNKAVNGLLKEELQFKGLVFTDALNMRGVSKYFNPGEVDVRALLAGNDVLLFPEDVPTAITAIKQAIEQNQITVEEVEQKVKSILQLKKWTGLNQYEPVDLNTLHQNINMPAAELIIRELIESSITLVTDENNKIPYKNLDQIKFASLSISSDQKSANVFQNTLGKYAPFDHYQIDKNSSDETFKYTYDKLKEYDEVIVSLHDMSRYNSRNYGITQQTLDFLSGLKNITQVTISIFGSPYSLKYFESYETLLMCYEENDLVQQIAAEILFGAVKAKGKLPITASPEHSYGKGLLTQNPERLKYTIPEEVGIDRADLQKIDSITEEAISAQATPGCQILVAKEGKVIFEKAYGYHTYDSIRPVLNKHLYDLASITKIAATTISIMKLDEEHKVRVTRALSHYLPELKSTNKSHITIKQVLLHESGMLSWIPFYRYTLTEEGFCDENYCYAPNDNYATKVAEDLYIQREYKDSIFFKINESEVRRRKRYVYSDLGYYFNKELVEEVSNSPFDEYVSKTFYKKLGTATLCFNPYEKHSLKLIVPTENDTIFRKQLIHGYVHDQGAAMLGGISGHAGLFSNANDLAKVMQMLLNGGSYGYEEFLRSRTINKFTHQQSARSRRGLGFDKPEMNLGRGSPTSRKVSAKTFGHTGFTGTCAWVDPEYDLVYIFLSNRIHPDMMNKKLIHMNIRTRIQDVIYKAILNSEEDNAG